MHNVTPPPPQKSGSASSIPAVAYYWAAAVVLGFVLHLIYKHHQVRSHRRMLQARRYAQERSDALHAWLRAWIDEHLPTSIYSQRAAQGEEEDCTMCLITHSRDASGNLEWIHATQCAICLAEFVEGDYLRLLPCRHFFHTQCADEWLARPDVPDSLRTCPICKAVALNTGDGQGTVMAPASSLASSATHSHAELLHEEHGSCDEECACEHEHDEHDEHDHDHATPVRTGITALPVRPITALPEVRFRESLWNGQWVVAPVSPPTAPPPASTTLLQESMWNGQWIIAPALLGVRRLSRRIDNSEQSLSV